MAWSHMGIQPGVALVVALILVFFGLYVWTLIPTQEERAIDIATNNAVMKAIRTGENVDFNVYNEEGIHVYSGTATPMGYVYKHFRRKDG